MFCKKCGNQLNNDDAFCSNCGEPLNNNKDNINNTSEVNNQINDENNTGKIFMDQLGDLTKTGSKVIKDVVKQTSIKAKELSTTVENSQSLNQLGEKKKLFMFVCGALVLNLLLLISKTVYFDISGLGEGNFSVIEFCSEMIIVINKYGGGGDGPLYTIVKYLEIIGVIFMIVAAVKTFLPILKNDGSPISVKLIKISAIFSISITFLFMLLCSFAYSENRGVEFHLTFFGWLYVIESIVFIVSLFKFSPRVKKGSTSQNFN